MVFLGRFGNILKQSVTKQITSQVSASNPSIYRALRCMSSSKLFVGARIIIDREQNGSRGFGFVTFASTEEASSAIQAMDGQDLQGRRVRVNQYDGGNFGGGDGGGYGRGQNYRGGGYVGGQNYGSGDYDGSAPQQYGGGSGGFNNGSGSCGVAAGVGESYFGGAAAGTNVTAESYTGAQQYGGSGGFKSGGGSCGLAEGVGVSYFGRGAAGTTVTDGSGFGNSGGGQLSVSRSLLWFRCGGVAGSNVTAESGFGDSYFGSYVGGSRKFHSADRSRQFLTRKTIKQERLRLLQLKQQTWLRLLKTKKGFHLLRKLMRKLSETN